MGPESEEGLAAFLELSNQLKIALFQTCILDDHREGSAARRPVTDLSNVCLTSISFSNGSRSGASSGFRRLGMPVFSARSAGA